MKAGQLQSSGRFRITEGRKFGVGLVLISQRPNRVDETIMAQCNSFLVQGGKALTKTEVRAGHLWPETSPRVRLATRLQSNYADWLTWPDVFKVVLRVVI
jgi:hypothetical protein